MYGFFSCTLLSVFGLLCAKYIPDSAPADGDGEINTAKPKDCFFNFCNTTEGYPTAKILRILENNKKVLPLFESVFIVDVVDKRRISRSISNNESEVPDCKIVKSTLFPQVGRNVQGSWKTIVNVEAYKQGIAIETCQNDGESCSASSIIGKCQQRFENKDMVTINEKGAMQLQTFSIPAGCTCVNG